MISAPVFDVTGKESEKATLPEKVFGQKSSGQLMTQAIRVYLSNQRRAGAKTKTRGEVAKTTAKMYKQKGTGRARHGSYAAGIFVGGGALTEKAGQKNIRILTGVKKTGGKTKQARVAAEKMQILGSKVLLVRSEDQQSLAKAWRNIEWVTVVTPGNLNAYRILVNKHVVITTEALEAIVKKYVN